MIEEQGKVVEVDQQGVWIEVQKHSACASCSMRAGCGQRLLAEHAGRKQMVVCVENPQQLPVTVNDNVVVGIAEGAFVKASVALYVLPLLMLFMGAGLADTFALPEGSVILAGLSGLFAGLMLVRLVSRRWQRAKEYHPVLIRLA